MPIKFNTLLHGAERTEGDGFGWNYWRQNPCFKSVEQRAKIKLTNGS